MLDDSSHRMTRLTLSPRRNIPAARWTRRRALAGLCLLAALMPTALGAPVSADSGTTQGMWKYTGYMHDARASHTATLLPSGDVLVAGGSSAIYIPGGPSPDLASAELYHPATGKWTQTGMLNTPRQQQTATLLPDGQVLVAGGFDCTDTTCTRIGSAELYNPINGAWTPTGSLITARDQHTATLLPDGQVLIAGGFDPNHTLLNSAELYDPATGTFTATGSLNVARAGGTATLLPDGQVLVAGGHIIGGLSITSAELYDPGTGTWTPTGSLNIARDQDMATLLPNGKVLVAGGADFTNPITPVLSSAELYDPGTGTWSLTGSMHVARGGAMATLLHSGQVLVAGGFVNFDPGYAASAELYDPATGAWRLTSPMRAGRGFATATLLPGGKVLVAGGNGNSLRRLALASAELYTP